MKQMVWMIIAALALASCGSTQEQNKLCEFMHTCDRPEAPSDSGML